MILQVSFLPSKVIAILPFGTLVSTWFLHGFCSRHSPQSFPFNFLQQNFMNSQVSFIPARFLKKGISNNFIFNRSLWSSCLRQVSLHKLEISQVSLMDESSINRQSLLNYPQYISSESPMHLFPREYLVLPNRLLQLIPHRASCPYWSTLRRQVELDLPVQQLMINLLG